MSRRAFGFLIFAVVVSAVCVRLGFWQLNRLAQRRALNAMLSSRLGAPPAPIGEILRDTSAAAFRRATVTGTYDFANEFALASRTRQGSPGANIITPLRVAGSDTAVLVNRGWVYAPDAMTVDFTRWGEPAAATVSGFLLELTSAGRGPVHAATNARVVRRLQPDSLMLRLSYPIAPFILVATDSAAASVDSVPARLPPPTLDEGPHLGYAIQWFAFALIGLIGAAVGVRADRRGTWRARPVAMANTARR